MILTMAAKRPPFRFVSPENLVVMKALVCLARYQRVSDVIGIDELLDGDGEVAQNALAIEDVIEVLKDHDALELVGGEEAVAALVEPRPELDAALAELEDVRSKLRPIEDERLVMLANGILGGVPEEA